MFDLNNPYDWQIIVNIMLVLVAAVAASFIGIRLLISKNKVDVHSMYVPELGLTMADGGDEIDSDDRKE